MTSTITTGEVVWFLAVLLLAACFGVSSGFSGLIKSQLDKIDHLTRDNERLKAENEGLWRRMVNVAAFGKEKDDPPPAGPTYSAGNDLTIGGDATGRDHITREERGRG